MSTVTVTEALNRAANLIPVRSASVQGQGVYVCSPPSEVPEELRDAARKRSAVYFLEGNRSSPGYAPRYVVTSYGVLIAWVTLDGKTHFAGGPLNRHQLRHQRILADTWPERFPPGE